MSEQIKKSVKEKHEAKILRICNDSGKFNKYDILISGNFWNYLNILGKNLNYIRFKGYFNKTLYLYPKFKKSLITKKGEISDYFRRCQLLSILQIMAFTNNSLPFLNKKQVFIKIGPSKNNKKNCVLIDDSTITNSENDEVRDTLGTEEEPHRGFKMFNELNNENSNYFIDTFYHIYIDFLKIISMINEGDHIHYEYDPILQLQELVHYCKIHNYENVIYLLACEIHDTPHELSYDDQVNLFNDLDNMYKLWNDGFITDNQGKLRIIILLIYFDKFVKKLNI
jgi:hypothetical protein